jgi:oligoribonuclease
MEAQMPTLDNRAHYRVIDVSSLKELAWRWYPEAMKQAPVKLEAHRALGDIMESIAELKFYRAQFMQPPESA